MNYAIFKGSSGMPECSCGAKAKRANGRNAKRFLRRHPALCSARRKFAQHLAQTTRVVDDEERRASQHES